MFIATNLASAFTANEKRERTLASQTEVSAILDGACSALRAAGQRSMWALWEVEGEGFGVDEWFIQRAMDQRILKQLRRESSKACQAAGNPSRLSNRSMYLL